MMDFADLKPLRRWADLPRRLTHNSRWIYVAFFAIPGMLLLTLSYMYLQPSPITPSRGPPHDEVWANAPIDATPSPTPELSSVTIHQSGESGAGHLDHSMTPLAKPEGIRVVGVVFYGRRDRSSLLECYLRKNLVSNGGWVDEVIWAANTEVPEDLAYGEEIAKSAPEYTYMPITNVGYSSVYLAAFKDPNAIYVKMDDYVVFIDQSAIPRLVMTLLNNPRALLISSNVVNNPALGWVHYHMGAVQAYIPEIIPQVDSLATKENGAWRASELPTWNESMWKMPELDKFYSLFGVNEKTRVPRHRWIPTRNLTYLYQTPVASSQYDAFGNNLMHWPLAAQAHYSLLQNIEERRLGRYFMVHGSDEEAVSTWDMQGSRISINFMAIRGSDILNNEQQLIDNKDDEHMLTEILPVQLNRPVLVETTSVVAHFAFGPQKNLFKTDILERYHNYAAEMICPNSILEPETVLASREMAKTPALGSAVPPTEE